MTDEVDRLMAGIAGRKVRDLARAITLVENGGRTVSNSFGGLRNRPGVTLIARGATSSASPDHRGGQVHDDRGTDYGVPCPRSVGCCCCGGPVVAVFRRCAARGSDPRQSHSRMRVFIRSMASRGHLGGLAAAAGHVLRVLDAAGFDVVLVETVGVGQSEVEVAAAADTTIVMLAPGMGDGIQAAKAGILEIGDLFVVNKADREGAQTTARDLRQMISLATSQQNPTSQQNATAEADGSVAAWTPPVLTAIASTDTGIDDIVAAIADHRAWALDHGELDRRRLARAREEVVATAVGMVRSRIEDASSMSAFEDSVSAVAHGEADVHGAAEALVDEMGSGAGS